MSLTLQPLLRSRYRRENWTTILRDLFPDGSVTLLATPSEIDAPHDSVTATRQLGHLQLADGSRVALVEVEASDTVKLARNRIALRNFIGKLIVPGSSDAVLAVFHQPGKEDWRLTYASRRTTLDPETFAVTHSETSPRRFTFLLGPGETCKTAAGRLKELEGKDKLTLDELERAFSVERLNKDFFKRYKEFYERFTAHLLTADKAAATRAAFGIPVLIDPKEQDKADKPVRDFAKKLLGRLVFLHFLQKKRWLGCPKGTTDWSAGEENFIADFFEKAKAAGEADRFHSKYLTPLFFEALNTPDRKGDLFPLTGTRLPYLNGGLFEEDAPALRALDFPPLLFEELLGFFGEYHFTIDENDPEDHEVGIDPEMLGHIFENLLEDNKDKGAFYTPKAIVQYMARESLRHYLETHLGPDPEIATLLAEKDLTRLAKDGFVRQHAKQIAKLLEDVKICDPAIGSGAFPIGLLQEILWTRLTLNWELNTPEDRARLKREIIKNSIHGVDLDPGAVEIARLRFWLALVVDEEIPRPLPNLDYKIHRADSLVEYIRGEPAHLGDVNTAGGMMKAAVDDLIAAKKSRFDAHRLPEKRAARFALYRALASLAQLEFTRMRNDEGLFGTDPVRTAQLDKGVKEFGQRIREIDAVKKEKAALQDSCLARLQDWFEDPERPTFLWHLHFGEVFAKGGFDIVIANPPYLLLQDGVGSQNYKNLIETRFRAWVSFKIDLYHAFIGLASQLGKSNSVISYITPSNFRSNNYCKKLRASIGSKMAISELVVFHDQVFDASVNTCLFNGLISPLGEFGKTNLFDCETAESIFNRKRFSGHISTSEWMSGDPIIPNSSATSELLKKIERPKGRLSDFSEISFGMQLRNRKLFPTDVVFSSKSNNQNLSAQHRLCTTGRNIKAYCISYEDIYCYFNRDAKMGGCWDEDKHFSNRKLLTPQIGNYPNFALDTEGRPVLNTAFMVCIKEGCSEYWLLAVLNSRLIKFYWINKFGDGRRQFPKIKGEYLKKLPIPPATPEDQARLATLAERAAGFAKSGDKDSLRATEREIDGIVHRLFSLTPAEIALIEGAVAS